MQNTIGTSSDSPAVELSAETSSKTDKTLAQQIADNEHQMYLKSQQHIQEIEDEVLFLYLRTFLFYIE